MSDVTQLPVCHIVSFLIRSDTVSRDMRGYREVWT